MENKLNILNNSQISEEEFNDLLKNEIITTNISIDSKNVKSIDIIFYTPYGLGKKTIQYLEL